ncbi:MAG TPA: glycoside hydrolase family 3 C-terminal domain-containing protein [Solirubrobacteraceae bacterium]|nr:glycoside hydrolase family 3 C-terminal domain-containing protein [Solirubrobacteraceae bacterium]
MFHARMSRPSLTPRRSLVLLGASLALALAVALALAGPPAASAAAKRAQRHASASSAACPWVNSQAPTSSKVADVIDHMSLDDEITMVEGHGTAPPNPYVFYMPGIPNLCIPQLGEEDGPAGVADQLTGVTQLPAGVGLAASFNPSLARQYGQVIGSEELGKGAAVNLGPTINIDRDPRWGRSFETFTEDPFLNSALAVSEIKGVQSTGEISQVKHYAAYNQETNRNTPQDDVIVSTRVLREIYEPAFQASVQDANVGSVMCSYSSINGEFACQNNDLLNTTLKQLWGFAGFVTSDYGALHDTDGAVNGTDQEQPFATNFGTPLEQEVQNGTVPRAVLNTMVSRMLTEMFRFGIIDHPPAGTPADPVTSPAHVAVATSVADQSATLLKNDDQTLPLSPNHGGTVAVIGPSASASPTYGGGGSAYVIPSQTSTPLQGLESAAGHGTHLLYQQGLPTDDALPAIPASALSPAYAPTPFGGSYSGTLTAPETGTYVLAIENPCGCYTPTYLSLNGQQIIDDPSTPPVHVFSVAVRLTAGQTYSVGISGDSDKLLWGTPSALAPGISDAVAAAKSADTAVVVVSDDTESEATDRLSLNLPSAQDELISAVAAVNPHTVVVVNSGAPVVMPWLSQVASVLEDWYPGQVSGTSLARVLFGRVDPSGHLPVSFPTDLNQVPASTAAQWPGVSGQVQYSEGLDVGYRWYDAHSLTPLFPFGYGLSYTKFAFSHLRVTGTPDNGVGDMHVSATVTDVGQRAGSDVAQLYLADPASAGEPPRQLVGFQRVNLGPGRSSQVQFTVTPRDTWWWDESANGWNQSTGHYGLFVGDSSSLSDLPLRSGFDLGASPRARQVHIQAPATMQAGKPSVVTVSLTSSGNAVLRRVTLALQLPQGWKATAIGRSTFKRVSPSAAPATAFEVTPPKYTPDTNATVHATATLGPDAVREAGVSVGVS